MGVNSQFVQARQKRGVVLRMPIAGIAQGQPSSNLACGLRIGCPLRPPRCITGRLVAPPEKDTDHCAGLFGPP
jgi:hypothetical protein